MVTHAGRTGDVVGHGSFRYTASGTNTASDAVSFHDLNELCQVMCVVSGAGLANVSVVSGGWRSLPAMDATIGVLAGGIIKSVVKD